MKHLLLLQLPVFSHVVEGRPDIWVAFAVGVSEYFRSKFLNRYYLP